MIDFIITAYVKTMTKTVVFEGKSKRAGLVRAGMSKSRMNITSESQDRNESV